MRRNREWAAAAAADLMMAEESFAACPEREVVGIRGLLLAQHRFNSCLQISCWRPDQVVERISLLVFRSGAEFVEFHI
jgi:hypothetical protein